MAAIVSMTVILDKLDCKTAMILKQQYKINMIVKQLIR